MENKKIVVLDYASGKVHFFRGNPEWQHEDIEEYLTESEGFRLPDIEWMCYDELKNL